MDEYKKSVKDKIKQFSDFLGQKTWFTGDEVMSYEVNIIERPSKGYVHGGSRAMPINSLMYNNDR